VIPEGLLRRYTPRNDDSVFLIPSSEFPTSNLPLLFMQQFLYITGVTFKLNGHMINLKGFVQQFFNLFQ